MQNNKLGLVPAPEKKKKKKNQLHTFMQIQASLNIYV